MPPPTPVPIITPNTTAFPLPAPSTASDKAKQFASFSKLTLRPSSSSKFFLRGLPFNQIELAFLIKDESAEIAPGMPTPIDSTTPNLFSKLLTIDLMPSIVPS